jgi:hypothetical protein
MDPAAGLALCMELGLLYLDANRLKDADAFFARLEAVKEPYACKMLGQVGRGVALALNNLPAESNQHFKDVFGKAQNEMKGRQTPFGVMKPDLGQHLKEMDGKLEPIGAVLKNPRWRYWVYRARWYNTRNGLKDPDAPLWLVQHFAITENVAAAPKEVRPFKMVKDKDKGTPGKDGGPPKPPDRDKGPRREKDRKERD